LYGIWKNKCRILANILKQINLLPVQRIFSFSFLFSLFRGCNVPWYSVAYGGVVGWWGGGVVFLLYILFSFWNSQVETIFSILAFKVFCDLNNFIKLNLYHLHACHVKIVAHLLPLYDYYCLLPCLHPFIRSSFHSSLCYLSYPIFHLILFLLSFNPVATLSHNDIIKVLLLHILLVICRLSFVCWYLCDYPGLLWT